MEEQKTYRPEKDGELFKILSNLLDAPTSVYILNGKSSDPYAVVIQQPLYDQILALSPHLRTNRLKARSNVNLHTIKFEYINIEYFSEKDGLHQLVGINPSGIKITLSPHKKQLYAISAQAFRLFWVLSHLYSKAGYRRRLLMAYRSREIGTCKADDNKVNRPKRLHLTR